MFLGNVINRLDKNTKSKYSKTFSKSYKRIERKRFIEIKYF